MMEPNGSLPDRLTRRLIYLLQQFQALRFVPVAGVGGCPK